MKIVQKKLSVALMIMVFFGLLSVCLAARQAYADENDQFNVVLIVGDAVRPDFLNCYGGDAKTPHLDWLRDNGVLFERAYAAGPWTAPSSVSIMTGSYASSYKTMEFQGTVKVLVPEKELMLFEVLKQRGYATRYNIENWNASIHNNLQGVELLSHDLIEAKLSLSLHDIEERTGIYKEGMYDQSYSFLDFLLNVDTKQPFFAIKWFMDPHAPYNPNHKFRDNLRAGANRLPEGAKYVGPSSTHGHSQKTELETSINRVLYKASIESVDERVGFILTALKSRNLLSKTFVIFTSDHGELFGEHGLWEHGRFGKNASYYEQIVRVPLIMYGPTLPKGKIVSASVSLVDLMPSIKQLLALDYPEDMQGKSFVNSVVGNEQLKGDLYFSNIIENEQIDALINGEYKLISFRDGTYVLYNLQNDPAEQKNLVQIEASKAQSMIETIVKIRGENKKRRENRPGSETGFVPKSKEEEKVIIKQLKSLGYIK